MRETKFTLGQIEDSIQQCPLTRLNGSEMLIQQRLMILHHYFRFLRCLHGMQMQRKRKVQLTTDKQTVKSLKRLLPNELFIVEL